MKRLFLADLKDLNITKLRKYVAEEYKVSIKEVTKYDFLVAYEDQWGYEGSSFFLMKKGGRFYTNYASHCSCYGFEDQFKPEMVTKKYLKSEKFNVFISGYCDDRDATEDNIKNFIKAL